MWIYDANLKMLKNTFDTNGLKYPIISKTNKSMIDVANARKEKYHKMLVILRDEFDILTSLKIW